MNRIAWQQTWHSFRLLRRMVGARRSVDLLAISNPLGALLVVRVMRDASRL